jgi:hypothetical protein
MTMMACSNPATGSGTVQAPAGVALDQALIYGTGCFAFAGDATGWIACGGLAYAFNNLSAKIESLYVSLEAGSDIPGRDDKRDRFWCGARWSQLPLRQLLITVC